MKRFHVWGFLCVAICLTNTALVDTEELADAIDRRFQSMDAKERLW